MKKRLLNIFFALALVLGLSPVSVFAEGADASVAMSETTSIDATVKPILGAKVGLNGTDVSPQTHVKVFTATPAESKKRDLVINGVTFYKILDENYTGDATVDEKKMEAITDKNEVFQDGYHYYVIVEFTDYNNEDGFLTFAKTVTGTINGKTASVSLRANDQVFSLAAYVDVSGFYNIDTTLTAPALGETADYKPTFTVTEDLHEDRDKLGITTIEATTWYKIAEDDFTTLEDSEWVEMEEDEEYAKGYFYMVKFDVLESNNPDNYDWLYRTISKNLTGTLNEEDFDKIVVADDQYSAELYKLYEPFGGRKKVVSAQEVANPKTADEGNLAISLLLLSVTGGAVAAVAILGKRR